MAPKEGQRYQKKIARLQKEIDAIDEFFYGSVDDPQLRYGMLERKRDDVVRGIVLQFHTGIENLLDGWLRSQILGTRGGHAKSRSVAARALDDLLEGPRAIRFARKCNLLRALGDLRRPDYDKLLELDALRNKCSHNWLLNSRLRKGKKPRAQKRPLLRFKDRNLYEAEVLREFIDEYRMVYVRLFQQRP